MHCSLHPSKFELETFFFFSELPSKTSDSMGVATPHLIERATSAPPSVADSSTTMTSPDNDDEESYVTLYVEYKPLCSQNLREKLNNE